MMGFSVVGNPAATVMTSSPGVRRSSPSTGDVSAESASRFAEDPELQRMPKRVPTQRAIFASNWSANRPAVSQKSSDASVTSLRSDASNTRPEIGTGD